VPRLLEWHVNERLAKCDQDFGDVELRHGDGDGSKSRLVGD